MKIILGLLMSLLFLMSSCEKMDEVHQKYIPNGEIIYRVKPTNILAYSGNKRVKLTWELAYPTFVTKCEVKSGSELLAEVPVVYGDLVKLECMLTNLEEKTYTLSLFSRDKDGNSSIKNDIVVEVFGEKYISTLKTTTSIKSLSHDPNNNQITYINLSQRLSSKIFATSVTYRDLEDNEQTVLVDADKTTLEVNNLATNSYIKLNDIYKPNATCIDLFTAPVKEYATEELVK